MHSLLPFGVAAASIGLAYFMCIRPMRRGCLMLPNTTASCESGSPDEAAEIERLRGEIAALRGAASQASGRRPTLA